MNRKSVVYGIAGILVGSLITVFAVSGAVNNSIYSVGTMMGVRADALDAHFIEQMIPHHEDAITMAKLAPQKAKRQEIKTLAQNIIEAQTEEIVQMKQWYKDWYGKDLPTGTQVMGQHGMTTGSSMHMGMMGNNTDQDKLKNADDFDKVFIEDMIPHHQMAVMMATMLKSGTTRLEMKQLADNIITSQTDEINQMRSWYQEWGYQLK